MKRTAIISLAGLDCLGRPCHGQRRHCGAIDMTKNLIHQWRCRAGNGEWRWPAWFPSRIGRTPLGHPSLPSNTERPAVGFSPQRRLGPGNVASISSLEGRTIPTIRSQQRRPVNLASFVKAIKGGHVTARLTGWLGGSGTRTDQAFVEVDFKNKTGSLVGTSMVLAGVTESVRGGKTEFVRQMATAAVPKNARSAFVQLQLQPRNRTDLQRRLCRQRRVGVLGHLIEECPSTRRGGR